MRVIHFIKNLDRRSGGPSVSVPGLCQALSEIPEMDVHLVTRDSDERVSLSESDSLHLHLVDGSRNSVSEILESLRFPEQPGEVVVHLHGLWDPMNHHASRFADHRGIPTVYSVRGMLEPWALRHKRLKKKLGWWLYQKRDLKRAALLHATALREEESFARCGLRKIPSIVLPNGVSKPTQLEPIPQAKVANSPTLLFLGRIHPVKGLVPLLQAWSHSAPEGWRFQITGPDEMGHREELENLIRSHDMGKTVTITPPVNNEEKWIQLASADLFVLPSFTENFGLAAAEALTAGTPVAASTATPWEFLPKERAGWCVAPTESGWSEFLRQLEGVDAQTLRKMGQRGEEMATRNFSWPSIAESMASHYFRLLKKSG